MSNNIKIKEEGQIGIMAAIERMRKGGSFTLVFVYGSGTRRGEVGLKRCVYGSSAISLVRSSVGMPKESASVSVGRHVEHGTLPLTDLEAVEGQQYITLLISHLRYFNNLRIIF